jgi:viologen exporter family transport system ATP-binding protein
MILTTHDLADIERLCRRLVVIDHGRVVHDGTLAELHDRYGSRRRVFVELDEPLAASHGRLITFSLASGTAGELVASLASVASLRGISIQEPEIEDVIARLYVRLRPQPGATSRRCPGSSH